MIGSVAPLGVLKTDAARAVLKIKGRKLSGEVVVKLARCKCFVVIVGIWYGNVSVLSNSRIIYNLLNCKTIFDQENRNTKKNQLCYSSS